MIAYNKTWLANLRVQALLKKDLHRGYITQVEFKAITEKYPVGFYMPGLFARIGLFFLTCIVVSFADGLLTLFFAASNLAFTGGWMIFLGLLSYAGLEAIVNIKHHYRSGVDDALLFISACLFVTGFAVLFWKNDTDYLTLSAILFVFNLYFSIRFADMLMSALCCAAFLGFIFFSWTKVVPAGFTTAPFIMMLVSAGIYWISAIRSNNEKNIDYHHCLLVAQIIGLATLYAAGNYYVVQTLSDELNGRSGGSIPFGTFFWALTTLLPLIYIGFGIRKKNVILLRTGLLLITISVITFRNYYHSLPIGTTLVIAGAAILGIAYGIMKYLKTSKFGFTYAEPDNANLMDHLNVESLIVAETFSTAPAAPIENGPKFGAGDFGGGGSSSSF